MVHSNDAYLTSSYNFQVQATWQQRSFQNATFFDGTGPVFICVGGEGPAMDASVLVSSGSTLLDLISEQESLI